MGSQKFKKDICRVVGHEWEGSKCTRCKKEIKLSDFVNEAWKKEILERAKEKLMDYYKYGETF